MKKIILAVVLCLFAFITISCQSTNPLKDENITSIRNCLINENKYWHNNACWEYADEIIDGGLIAEEVDEYIAKYKEAQARAYVNINGEQYPVNNAFILPQDEKLLLSVTFLVNNERRSISVLTCS